MPLSQALQDGRGRERQDRAAEEAGRHEDLPGGAGRQRPQSAAPVAQLVVGTRRSTRLRDGPLDKHGVGSRILDATAACQRGGTGASGRIRQGLADPRGGTERGLTSSEIVSLHEREFRARQGPPALDRPQADEWRMAGLARYHGQGRGRAALPQRGRGQDAVRGAAAARPDQRAAGVADATLAGQRSRSASLPRPFWSSSCPCRRWRWSRSPSFPSRSGGHAVDRRRNCCRRPCRSSAR